MNVSNLTHVIISSPSICQHGGSGTLFPAGGDSEQDWPQGLRIILYLLGLCWAFLGVGIAADCFMGAIEAITSKRVRKFNSKTNKFYTVTVWNATVANLSLMALGSSAPEILLNVIEILGNDFMAGDLGPSTIVGSAAFNLLCITAVCVVAIESPDIRKIKEVPVYAITASFSVFAYLWLLVILMGITPNVVDLWEALLTFAFFPILLVLAYLADRGYIGGGMLMGNTKLCVTEDMTKEELAALEAEIRQTHGADLTECQVMRIIKLQHSPPTSRAQYRVAATRAMTGGHRVHVEKIQRALTGKVEPVNEDVVCPVTGKVAGKGTVEFAKVKHATLESAGALKIEIIRKGDETVACKVKYETREGTAKKDSDYITASGVLEFAAGETSKEISVQLVDDFAYEEDEDFYVDLLEVDGGNAILGSVKTTTVHIIDDDLPGVLKFSEDELVVHEDIDDVVVNVIVERNNGSTGKVTCNYKTEDDSAVKERDYIEAKGTLEFENGQMSASFPLTIKALGRYDHQEMLRVLLTEPTGGAKFCHKTDGGDDHNILTVIIMPGSQAKNRVDALFKSMQGNWDKSKIGHSNWKDQFKDALLVNGGGGDEEEEEGEAPSKPGVSDYVMHALTLPWKLLFACVPPTDYCDGWICFFVSLMGIGLVTMFINDLASLLGCVMCIPDAITAITFVALGTSLPDTFASMSAAQQDPYADASIGNVVGSNSVNVFLGLGIPWSIGSIYWLGGSSEKWLEKYMYLPEFKPEWAADGGAVFVVIAGDLGFSVIVFCCCALVCLAILAVRRQMFGGELGGPKIPKIATAVALVSLWFLYVALTISKTLPWACAPGIR